MKFFKKLDKFGEKFSFNYNGSDKYSTIIGGIVCLIFCLVSLSNFIINLFSFIKKENYTLQFYTVNSYDTEKIILNNSSIIFGIDCGNKNTTKEANDKYFDLMINFKVNNKIENNKYNTPSVNITTKCNKTDFKFDKELYDVINNLAINNLTIEDFNCLTENENIIEGFYTSPLFSYYKITVSIKKGNSFSEINDFLFENDCKLQFYYIDYNIDIKNYRAPFKPLINSLFLQLNPDFYIKKNVFFMNYHFKTYDRLFYIYESEEDDKNEMSVAGFSRIEDYFLYKGASSNFKDKDNFATLYIRADNKRMEIKRENQNFLNFFAENSAFWGSLFIVLNFFFTIYNGFHANRSISKKLFFIEEVENNKFNILKKRNSITSSLSLLNKVNVNNINDIKEITITNNEDKDNKNNNVNTMPVIYIPKMVNNFISPLEKDINSEEININKKKIEKKKEKGKKTNKYPSSICLSYFQFLFCCCKKTLNFKEKIINKAVDIFDKKLDIYIYVKNMILIDIMFKVLLGEANKDCVHFLSRSLIYLDKIKKDEEEELYNFYHPTSKLDSDNSNKLFSAFQSLLEKDEKVKTEIEKKIISLYIDK